MTYLNPFDSYRQGHDSESPHGASDDIQDTKKNPKLDETPVAEQHLRLASRRDAVKGALGGLGALVAGGGIPSLIKGESTLPAFSGKEAEDFTYPEELEPTAQVPQDEKLVHSAEYETVEYPTLFENEDAQEIADQYGITSESIIDGYWQVDGGFDAFKSEELLPVFHPMVYDHSELLYKLANEKDVPVNFVAFIMSVETGGNPDAVSSAGAVGGFQLMPSDHLEGVVDESQWYDLEKTGPIAVDFMRDCLSGAREFLDPDGESLEYRHPDLFIWAAGMYNAGVSGASADYFDLPIQTQQYMHHAKRFIQEAQIAQGLRDKGYDNRQIIDALRSPNLFVVKETIDEAGPAVLDFSTLNYLAKQPLEDPANDNQARMYRSFMNHARRSNGETTHYGIWKQMHAAYSDGFIEGDGYERNKLIQNYWHIDTDNPLAS